MGGRAKTSQTQSWPPRVIRGLTVTICHLGGIRGALVKAQQMGPVDAATTSRCLVEFRCGLYAMSGICAGIPKSVSIGDLVLADQSFDYQAGKRNSTGTHELEHRSVSAPGHVITKISACIDTTTIDQDLRTDALLRDEFKSGSTKIGPIATGSAVINDLAVRKTIEAQGRNAHGIDMEVYAFYRALQLSGQNIDFFALKAVVDLADGDKQDGFQKHGCVVAAKMTASFIELFS